LTKTNQNIKGACLSTQDREIHHEGFSGTGNRLEVKIGEDAKWPEE